MMTFSLVILLAFLNLTFAQKYTIIRQVKDSNSGEIQPDLVRIPSSLCHDNGTKECPLMDGQRHSSCQCICDEKDDKLRLYKSTFGFSNATWKCVENTVMQRYSGCLFSLDGANGIHSVTLPSNTTFRHSLSNVTTGLYTSVQVGTICSLRAEDSTYLECDGKWKQLDTGVVNKRFHISYAAPFGGKHHVHFWTNSTDYSSYPLPSGRIIRLGITCSDRPWESSQCILVKIQGDLECPVSSVPSSSTPKPSPTTLSPTTLPSSTHSSKVTFTSSTKFTTITVPNVNNSDNDDDDDSGTVFSTTLIGAALGGIAVLVMLVIVIILIAKRQKKRDEDKRKNSTAPMVQEIRNESYEEDDINNTLDHPYVNVDPRTVSPTAGSTAQGNVQPHTNIRGQRSSVTNMAYDKVEVFGRSILSNNENNLEEQQNLPGTRKQPVYAIPEHLKSNNNNNEVRQSYYDVLERPKRHDVAVSRGEDPYV